ncbi:MAG: undecaprenyl-phosphate glucose phosphotransferase [Candidatus Thiodiazotropha sp. (ex Ctena orbiculata)]|uniref:Undecaprenyl-phosphate glucose phosphotransferase n=1 Tax=Candidatus Thiodiazotropha taylori TaxID=2792791 RepID=A0A944QW18_9GAMM|nr:undecaprenyl-phosphate glucose phosphotransferase [Candidatus Thiodiazotropha taylori]MBT3027048.1 undecaprenyl-phosphate glucose phosphotransferase [Candidatus Thiodiazotropha taylori]MBT3034682.1 undecaprenyl-phosphate glucose phosphotransferase [Candidatus Thiodiazotropha taylori]MBV2137403.1 undecaprenyl-phosphate glucose phosphotransferase [Candidatus Thiodiazotropha taylori]PUB90610.1 MAG: undecaprenyl-phosphate glucose phosphotransferase [gamma proteobacterium symbiont of Ctena orbicu
MLDVKQTDRSLLQRRNSLTTSLQAFLDGLAVVILIIALPLLFHGNLSSHYIILALALLGIMAVIYDRMNIYRHHGTMTKKALKLLKAWSSACAFLLLLAFVTKYTETYSRSVVLILFVLGYLAQVSLHFGVRLIQRHMVSQEANTKALIIGSGALANHLYERINTNPWMPEEVIGVISSTGNDNATDAANRTSMPILGNLEDIKRLIKVHDIQTIYIAVSLDSSPMIQKIYFDLLNENVNIHWAPNIFALNLINHSVKELAGIPILTLSETPLIGSHLLIKAVEDRVLAFLILILVSPIMLVTAILIKFESPGPVFFRQERTGWDGKNFRIWKFRSMKLHTEEHGVVRQATRDDPRVTRIGRFIRRTSIDELPQLFNVFAGQMSLVGPRPHALQHNLEYSKQIEAYLARHRIKPGITGLAQIRGFRGETKELEQMEKRVKYDLEYINNWSLWLDLSILVRTPFSLKNDNAY